MCGSRCCAPPLFQKVLAHLIAGQLSLLVFDAAHLRVLQQLGIEANQLLRDGNNGCQPLEALYPGQYVADARRQRRRQPPNWAAAIGKALGSVAGIALAARAADGAPCQQCITNHLPAVGQFARPDDLPGRIVDQR